MRSISAGRSSGEEACSIATLFADAARQDGERFRVPLGDGEHRWLHGLPQARRLARRKDIHRRHFRHYGSAETVRPARTWDPRNQPTGEELFSLSAPSSRSQRVRRTISCPRVPNCDTVITRLANLRHSQTIRRWAGHKRFSCAASSKPFFVRAHRIRKSTLTEQMCRCRTAKSPRLS